MALVGRNLPQLLEVHNWNAEFNLSPGNAPTEEPLRLDQFLKMRGITGTGGQAKLLIQGGEVLVNGQIETRRRRQLKEGDLVEFEGRKYPVTRSADE